MKAKHEPGKVWMLRRAGQYPNGSVEIENEEEVSITYVASEHDYESGFICYRRDARLFAKRIMECLKGTKG